MPVGNVPYHHRRKYSPQVPPDYQSRIFFGDYMRENRPSRVGGSGHVGTGTSTVAAPGVGTQLPNSVASVNSGIGGGGASSGEEQQYSSSAASSVAQDGSVNNFPGGLQQQQQQQHNGNGPTSPVSGSQISLGQQQRVNNNNNNIAVIGALAGSGSLSASGNNCCAGTASSGAPGTGCDSNGNDDGCADHQFHHQSSPGE